MHDFITISALSRGLEHLQGVYVTEKDQGRQVQALSMFTAYSLSNILIMVVPTF